MGEGRGSAWVGDRRLALVWALIALPIAIALAVRTPPLRVADEGTHVMRALQVGQGAVFGRRFARGAGGLVPEAFVRFDHAAFHPPGIAPQPVSRRWLAEMEHRDWAGERGPAPFPNTVIYPPSFYAVSAAAIATARAAGAGVAASVRGARIADAVAAVAIGAAAIAGAASGRLLLAALLGLPMVLSLVGSCSQDCLLIAAMAASASFLTRDGRGGGWRDAAGWAAVAVLMGSAGAARAPYLVLALLLPLSVRGAEAKRRAWAACIGAVGFGIGWTVLAQARTGTADLAPQLRWLAGHPAAVPGIAAQTLRIGWLNTLREFVGVLGWLDVPLPGVAVFGSVAVLALAGLRGLGGGERVGMPRAAGVALCLVASAGLLYGALYLSWTPLGAGAVDGVQGRYFLPIATFAVLALPRRQGRVPRWEATVLAAWMAAMGVEAMHRIAVHYPLVARGAAAGGDARLA